MKRVLSYYLMLVIIASASVKCDQAEDLLQGPGPGPINNNGDLTDDERIAVLEACDAKALALNNLKSIDDKVQFIDWLLDEGHFYSADFAGNDIIAEFKDGRVVFFVDTPLTDDATGGRLANGGTEYKTSDELNGADSPDNYWDRNARVEDLPKTKKVSLFNGMGKYFDDNTEAIEKIFKVSKTKYEPVRKPASVQNLMTVSGDAVFYIFTHGGAGAIPIPNTKDSIHLLSFWTTDAVVKGSEGGYKTLLDQKKLSYMRSTYDSERKVWHYGITSEFVKTQMKFGENCIIYFDACNSFRDNESAAQYRADVISKADKGQATYIGWTVETNAVFAPRASQFIFDRLLGTNTTGSNPGIPKETPIQRPFDLVPVFVDLEKRGFDRCANGATLKYTSTIPDEIILTPTIEGMDIEESSSTLYIFGIFGKEEGTVTLNNQPVGVTSWSSNTIICKIPETGENSVGDVIVISPQGHKSNPVPLTEWLIKLNYTSNDNGVIMEGVCTLRLRGDVHPTRTEPHETPKRPRDFGFGNGGPFNAKGSSATYTVKGHRTAMCTEIDGCTYKYNETVTTKSGTVNFVVFPSTAPGLTATYLWNPERKSIYINVLSISHPETQSTYVATTSCPGQPDHTLTLTNQFGSTFPFPLLPQSSESFKLEIADNYNIRPGNINQSRAKSWSSCKDNETFKITAQWDVVQPKKAPTEETPARVGE